MVAHSYDAFELEFNMFARMNFKKIQVLFSCPPEATYIIVMICQIPNRKFIIFSFVKIEFMFGAFFHLQENLQNKF